MTTHTSKKLYLPLKMSNRICLALDLKDNPALIKEYDEFHEPGNVWPEVIDSLYATGIIDMQIYRVENRLVMILEVKDSFTLEQKTAMDKVNSKVQEWERLMTGKYQQALPKQTQLKWVKMKCVFDLKKH